MDIYFLIKYYKFHRLQRCEISYLLNTSINKDILDIRILTHDANPAVTYQTSNAFMNAQYEWEWKDKAYSSMN